ncbi:hypothetical protein SteCoe_28415 [Stentor coeruleus]|uniref:Uncharacterized protein n=1 Tax=Stentor coeruleus TaxID=5963 RepID=A0A1R2B8B6_9CILI|nr:hypothetical protein SteCoe_28415 [Stentor coeruleus]
MSNSKESTMLTQFSLSIDSELFEDSALISGLDLDDCFCTSKPLNSQKINELLNEIDLINEDRTRLRLENEKLRAQLALLSKSKLHIELLQKVATKSLDEVYINRLKNPAILSPVRKSPKKIKIRSPSECFTTIQKPLIEHNFIMLKQCSEKTEKIYKTAENLNNSPPKVQRNTSARMIVSRNYLKYPKVNLQNKNSSADLKIRSSFQ